MLFWYLVIGAVTGIIMEHLRPATHDNISLFLKILVPTIAGLLWPAMLGWLIIETVRRIWT